MDSTIKIPVYNLFGETGSFPDVVHCERIIDRARGHDWTITPHRHRDMSQVFFIRNGYADVQLDGRKSTLNDNEFLFVPAQVVHGFAFRQGSDGLVLSFPQVLVTSPEVDLAQKLGQTFSSHADTHAVTLIEQIVTTFHDTAPFRTSLLVALSQALFAYLANLEQRQNTTSHIPAIHHMQVFDALIARHISENWSVSDYASSMSMTAGHLSRVCHAATGHSAARHIETVTMTEACRLLAFTRLAVAEVGYRLGYADPSYFSRRFRTVRGIAPSDYRAQVTG